MEDKLIHPAEGFLDAGTGRSQVHPQMAGAVEHLSVLHGYADLPAGLFHIVDGLAVGGAPVVQSTKSI